MNFNPKKRAEIILKDARREIAQKYGLFLDAVYQLEWEADPLLPTTLTTNGLQLFYSPTILPLFYADHGLSAVVYQILHLCGHCILGHIPIRPEEKDIPLFDALADFKVEKLLSGLYPNSLPMKIPGKKKILKTLEHPNLPLPRAFAKLKQTKKSAKPYLDCCNVFAVDDHDLWRRQLDDAESMTMVAFLWGEVQAKLKKNGSGNGTAWDETFSISFGGLPGMSPSTGGNQCGEGAGAVYRQAEDATASSMNYREILEDFLRKTIVEQESPLSIDPVWYHYGLDLLEDVPLIEPGEEDFAPASGTLVLAIDTSGSCQHTFCDQFLQEMDQILQELKLMEHYSSVVVIQCDYLIQEEQEIQNPGQWQEYLHHFVIRGGGGTSFTPVYERANEIEDVVGLLFLSDGEGEFPTEPAPFPSLFLLPFEEYDYERTIPPWVQQVTLPYELDHYGVMPY